LLYRRARLRLFCDCPKRKQRLLINAYPSEASKVNHELMALIKQRAAVSLCESFDAIKMRAPSCLYSWARTHTMYIQHWNGRHQDCPTQWIPSNQKQNNALLNRCNLLCNKVIQPREKWISATTSFSLVSTDISIHSINTAFSLYYRKLFYIPKLS